MTGAHVDRTTRWLAILLGTGLVLRAGVVVLAVTGSYGPYTRLHGDMGKYLSLGISLSRGEGFSMHYNDPALLERMLRGEPVNAPPPSPTGFPGPGYPFFLALLFTLFGYNLYAVVVVQVLLSTLTAWFVYLMARELNAKPLWALGFAVAYYPFALDAAFILTETVLTCVTAAALWLLIRRERGAFAGVVAGAAGLVKSVVLPFFAIAPLVDRRRLGVFWAGLAVVLLPWALRNYAHTGAPYLTPSYGGRQLMQLHNAANRDFGLFDPPGDINEAYPGHQAALARALAGAARSDNPVLQEYLNDREYAREALQYIRSDFGQFLRAMVHSAMNMWRMDYPTANWIRWASNLVLYVGLLPFALWGSFQAFRGGPAGARLLVAFLAYYVFAHAMLASEIRYRIAAMPAFFVVAAYGIARLPFREGARSSSSAASHAVDGNRYAV